MLYNAVISYLQQNNIDYRVGVLKHVISIDRNRYRLVITFITDNNEHYILLKEDNKVQQLFEGITNINNYQYVIINFMEIFNENNNS